MNQLDKDYQNLIRDILEKGTKKQDRTGTGTLSVFGRHIRHDMSNGFPILTTKKIAWKTLIIELLWFLRGETNIQTLVKQGCHIWDGDCYKHYCNTVSKYEEPDYDVHVDDPIKNNTRIMTREEFIYRIKNDAVFAEKWGTLGPIYGKQWRCWDSTLEKSFDEKIKWVLSGKTKDPIELENLAITEAAYDPNQTPQNKQIDQIETVLDLLKNDPDNRRILVNAYNVGELSEMKLPPCHYSFQFYSRELTKKERYKYWFNNNYETGMEYDDTCSVDFDNEYYSFTPKRSLSLLVNIRSSDVPLGLPFNIASYGLLLEIICKLINMKSDELILNLGDSHIYLNQIEAIKQQLDRESFILPRLKISNSVNTKGSLDDFLNSVKPEHFTLSNYTSHPKIDIPLSN